jgi:tripartite-type tricarboxylate transporter receptor subunit TctC
MSRIACFAAAAMALLVSGARSADVYPSRPIRVVVGLAAGGGVDIVARQLAEEMSAILGQRVIVENRVGAGGNIASADVARSAPDGYTLMMGNPPQLAINQSLYRNMGVNPEKDLIPIAQVTTLRFMAVVHKSVPVTTLKELVDYSRTRPEEISFGTAGVGSVGHLAVELLKSSSGAKLTHVPYRGAAPAINDLVAGHVKFAIDAEALLAQHVQSGVLKGLAVMARERLTQLPEVPTIREAGFDDTVIEGWQGLVAPAGTPPDVVERLSGVLREVLQKPQVRERLLAQAIIPAYLGPKEFGDLLTSERARWKKVVEATGARLD